MIAKLNQYLAIWKLLLHNIFLSLFSIEFYERIYKNFQGFGFKYFLSCLFIASIIKSSLIFADIEQIISYLKYNQQNQYSILLEKFFTQFPTINYDGKSIDIEKDTVLDIANPLDEKQKLLSINLSGKNTESQDSLIILSKENLIINSNKKPVVMPYYKISTKPYIINGSSLKTLIGSYITEFKYQIWTSIFIAVCFVFCSATASQYMLLIVLTGLLVKYVFNRGFQDGVRPILFSISGISALQLLLPLQFLGFYSILTLSLAATAILKVERADKM